MKSLKVKTVCAGNQARTTLAHPGSSVGDYCAASLQVREVRNIPDHVTSAEVVRLFEGTTDISYLYGAPRLVFDYSELGLGRILR